MVDARARRRRVWRGAAAARHCANDLLKGANSLLARSLPVGSPLLAAGFAWRHRSDFVLNFIGLFDTVAGIVSAGAVVLVVTGLSLALRRAAGWRARGARQDREAARSEAA